MVLTWMDSIYLSPRDTDFERLNAAMYFVPLGTMKAFMPVGYASWTNRLRRSGSTAIGERRFP